MYISHFKVMLGMHLTQYVSKPVKPAGQGFFVVVFNVVPIFVLVFVLELVFLLVTTLAVVTIGIGIGTTKLRGPTGFFEVATFQ